MRGIRLKLSPIEFCVLMCALDNEGKKSAHIGVVCNRIKDRLENKKANWEHNEKVKLIHKQVSGQ